MKYFDDGRKHNFVDNNNVFVGYDSHQDCCENAYWSLLPKKIEKDDEVSLDESVLEDYNFDTSYFNSMSTLVSLDGGGIAIFRMVNSKGEELFLHLINCHNGYYSHGFEMTADGKTLFEGLL